MYDKYKKIKNGGAGVAAADRYVSDAEKTTQAAEKAAQAEPAPGQVDAIDVLDEYVTNDEKTVTDQGKRLISVINASSPESFAAECKAAEQLYHSRKVEHLPPGQTPNAAFHFISSYRDTDVDPGLIHQIGVEIAAELAGVDFAAKICTHLNTAHYHNHIIINAYANDGTKKFQDAYNLYRTVRRISNEISLKYGLEIIDDDARGQEKNRKSPALSALKSVIRDAARDAAGLEDFTQRMQARGWSVTRNGTHFIYQCDAVVVPDYRLGTLYMPASIEASILRADDRRRALAASRSISREQRREEFRAAHNPPARVPRYTAGGRRIPAIVRFLLYLRKVIRALGEVPYDEDTAFRSAEDNRRAAEAEEKRLAELQALCERYGIATAEGLRAAISDAGMRLKTSEITAQRLYAQADSMADIADLFRHTEALAAMLRAHGIDPEALRYPARPRAVVRENRAALDPMTGREKRVLYTALKDSGYHLAGKFPGISHTEAEEILAFLAGKTDRKPDVLLARGEHAPEDAPVSGQPPKPALDGLDPVTRRAAVTYAACMRAAADYGADTAEKRAEFVSRYDQLVADADTRLQQAAEARQAFRELKRTESVIRKVAETDSDTAREAIAQLCDDEADRRDEDNREEKRRQEDRGRT